MKARLFLIFLLFPFAVFSQPPSTKFGKISTSDFEQKQYAVDSGAHAVVLFDIGSTRIIGNKKDWFSLEFIRHRRIHILNKNGYDHATVEIPLYANEELEEELKELNAVTYSYENGKLVETKLEKTALYKEKKDKNIVLRKFSFPNVKEGVIIEYEYKIISDFLFNLQPWIFQEIIPVVWSEYKVALPQFLQYTLISQGSHPFHLKEQKDKTGNYTVEQSKKGNYGVVTTERINIRCGVTEYTWAMKNIPPLKEESYTTTLANHMAKLEFQLAGYLDPLIPEKVMTTWQDLAKRLLKREDFGMQLESTNNWLPAIVTPLLQGVSTEKEKARKIYLWVRDNITCTDHQQIYTEKSLRELVKNKNGGVAEINLLLIAMLRFAGIDADPVILSTRSNGYVNPRYPVISKFNYVISRARIDGQFLLIDASHPSLGFAKLNFDCYNGQARVLNEAATELYLMPHELTEKEVINVNILGDPEGKWIGKVSHLYGHYESDKIRRQLRSMGPDAFSNQLELELGTEVKLDQLKLDSIDRYEEPVTASYNILYNNEAADILYINPLLNEGIKQNPFKSDERRYPVEMPFKIDETYRLVMAIPPGYTVEEMPRSLLLKLNQGEDAVFEYRISQSGSTITLQCRLEVNKVGFQPSEYNELREFFSKVVAKQDEQIVFKRKP